MKLIIGLGNPGFKYKKTRHNIGFMALDYIQKNIGGFSKWKFNKLFAAEVARNNESSVFLAKPQTYMNDSGRAAKTIIENLKLKIENLIVVHDDFDLPIGNFKLEKEKGSAGHKGVQSIIEALSTNNFWRLRIGIRPQNMLENTQADLPAEIRQPTKKAEDFVLKKFTRQEKEIIDKTIPEAVNILLKAISH